MINYEGRILEDERFGTLEEVCREKGVGLIIDYENLLDDPVYYNAIIKQAIIRMNASNDNIALLEEIICT